MKEYYVEYWTKDDNRKIAKRLYAQSALDAKLEIEHEENFKSLIKYPTEIK